MISIRPVRANLNAVELGQAVELQVEACDGEVETRCFLRHRNVLYPTPVSPWDRASRVIQVNPEAPGGGGGFPSSAAVLSRYGDTVFQLVAH